MNESKSVKITNAQYYHAFALFVLANNAQRQVNKFEAEMNEVLQDEMGSHASDAIYNYEEGDQRRAFDKALRNMKITVEKA